MIISLFMNAAPQRSSGDGPGASAAHGPAGHQAGELPRRERQKQKINHRRHARR
jgi:hypothetical protein